MLTIALRLAAKWMRNAFTNMLTELQTALVKAPMRPREMRAFMQTAPTFVFASMRIAPKDGLTVASTMRSATMWRKSETTIRST
jgi:hypothetical protein